MTLDGPVGKEAKNYRSYNIHSHDFFDAGNGSNAPAIYSTTSKGDKLRMATTSTVMSELGFLKYSFFKSLVQFKPAVTIMVFDWQSHQGDGSGVYDWRIYEAQVLAEVK